MVGTHLGAVAFGNSKTYLLQAIFYFQPSVPKLSPKKTRKVKSFLSWIGHDGYKHVNVDDENDIL